MEKMKLDIQKFASNGCTITVKSITQDIVNNKSTITIHGKLTTGGSSYNYGGAYMQPTISNQPVVGSQTASQTLSKKKYSIGPNGTKEDDWTFEVYHNSDGSCPTLTIKIKWYISDSTNGTATLSGGYKPDTIPRASSVSANDGTLNQTLTISIDRKNNTFTHTLKYVCGSTEGWIKDINNKVGTSATWTPPLSLANQNQSGDSVSCRIYCQTYNGSTAIGSATYKDITLTIPTMNPTASLNSVTDSNSYKNTYGAFIQNKSKIHITLSGTPQYTTINTYSWQIRKNNSSGTLLASGSTASIDYTPTESGTLYISGTVKDKRGKSGSTSTTVSIIAYSVPKCSLAVSRTNSTSASYTATGSGTVINNTNYTKNEVTYILKRGSTQIKSWNGSSLNQSGTDSISDQSYTYTLTAQDTISGITDTKTISISTTFTLMNFSASGKAMAIGKASEASSNEELFEVALTTEISKFGNINGIYFKENGYGDKFRIIPAFSGVDDDNKLKVRGAVGGAGTDPSEYDLATLSGKNGDLWLKGDIRPTPKYLDLTSLSTSNFYPVVFNETENTIDVFIRSRGAGASDPYNQNRIVFSLSARGWSDTPRDLFIKEYRCYQDNEITIGCIGAGTSSGYRNCIWLRGGLYYYILSNATYELKTSTTTYGSGSGAETFSVGTNYYGGSNSNVEIMFTPQSTIKNGIYINGEGRIVNGIISRDTGQVGTAVGNGKLVIKKATSSEAPNNGVVLEFGNSTDWTGQLFIGDNATQGIYYNGWSNGTRGSWRRLQDQPVSLYDNSSGTTATFTLSESAANFSYLIFMYKVETEQTIGGIRSTIVYSPNGQVVECSGNYDNGEFLYICNAKYTISGTSVTKNREVRWRLTPSTSSSNNTRTDNTANIKIYKVIGIR